MLMAENTICRANEIITKSLKMKKQRFRSRTFELFLKWKQFKYPVLFLFALFIMMSLTGCADVTSIKECAVGAPYGFFGGLWHGIIAPLSFIGSLFSDDIAMYAVNNNGSLYDLGFVLGAGILFGGSSRATN